jgi:ribosome-associated protein
MTKVFLEAKALSDLVIEGLLEKKGQRIVRMDLRNTDGAVTDFFVICTGTSDRHVDALADSVQEVIKKNSGENPISKEGVEQAEWILLDYVNVVVHIFQETKRQFYKLEALWGDADTEEITESFAA